MKKIVIYLIFFIMFFQFIFSEIITENKELIRVKITIGARTYFRHIQLSSSNYSNSFKIIKREE